MRFLPAFFLLGQLLWPASTYDDEWDPLSRTTKHVCAGQPASISSPGIGYDLYFESSIPGSPKVKISNTSLGFSFFGRKRSMQIHEVKKQHEGLYYWKSQSRYTGFITFKSTELVIKSCSVPKVLNYGEELRMVVPKEAVMLEFTPSGSVDSRILWSRINANNTRGARGTVKRDTWVANRIRFADAGRYTFLRESWGEVSSIDLTVEEVERLMSFSDSSWEHILAVPVSEAVLTFVNTQNNKKHVLFKNGMMTEDALWIFMGRLSIETDLDELKFTMSDVQSGDLGRYEIHEKKGRAFVLQAYGNDDSAISIPDLTVPVGIGVSIFIVLFCCCCVRRCCNKKSDTPAASPVSEQPAPVARPEPAYQPAAPSRVEHDYRPKVPRYQAPPPSYDELMANGPEPYTPYTPYTSDPTPAPPEAGAGAAADAPAGPSSTAPPDYQYQPRNWGMCDFLTSSPLNSDTTDSTVYHSNKLNF